MPAATRSLFGLEVPDAGPVFAAALVVHILAGLTCVATGALAATAPKRPGRHPVAGRIYYWGLAVVFSSATVLAVIRWAEDWYLFLIGAVAFIAGTVGYLARRRRWRHWVRIHIPGMGLSYTAMLTAFYVDNGPHLPLWNRLPVLAFWIGPSLIGVPLIVAALARCRHDAGASHQGPNQPASAHPVLQQGQRCMRRFAPWKT
jgi:hypothetical protein